MVNTPVDEMLSPAAPAKDQVIGSVAPSLRVAVKAWVEFAGTDGLAGDSVRLTLGPLAMVNAGKFCVAMVMSNVALWPSRSTSQPTLRDRLGVAEK